ncbi:hypothetical protein QE428_002596 [Microbacterium sp. SORGH_AS 505]|uniref:phage tail tube protein n=1 Tax=Microbacterium sp. SORGH_AS_0505 TaxID=3041770 RepID=UPI0027877B9C|nr:IPT/TIG domain-containing protein [Microbacterium sp. SORGH_AS_0505]MDQ1127563.1 hypothetical protein [Microbacterium sp. SORGH_AS_0505]
MNRVPLPAGTALGKSFEYGLDLNLGLYASPVWQAIRRMSGYAPTFPPTREDVATYDDEGGPNEDVTARSFAAAFTVQVNRLLSSGLYLPEVEKILAAAKSSGEAAVLDIRWYHKPVLGTPNPNDAGRAFVTVEASRQNTGNSSNEILSVSLTGKGSYLPIANPYNPLGSGIPTISSVAGDGGGMITIDGTGMLDVSNVTIDDVAVEHLPINAGTVVAQLPDGATGDVEIVVTNAAGASQAYTYTLL